MTAFSRSSRSVEADQLPHTALEISTIRQSYKHPTLCTVTVEGFKGHQQGARSPVRCPEHYWKLLNTDPRNERNLLLHLHTLDIYFWTIQDADSFIASTRKLLQHDQLELLDMPSAAVSHEKAMSPVVQQLESAAIDDPAYHNGQTRSSRTTSPSYSGTPKNDAAPAALGRDLPRADSANFQPLAYNPAAPAAPEPIKHREKTPPPVDAETGTGLAAAAYADHTQATSPQGSLSRPSDGILTSSQGDFGSPPAHPYSASYTSPSPARGYSNAPSTTGHRTSSVSSFPGPPSQTPANQQHGVPSFAGPPQSPGQAASPSSQQLVRAFSPPPEEKIALPLESPAAEILGNSYVGGAQQPLQHLQPQYADYLSTSGHQAEAPIGGYSNYSYSQQPQRGQHSLENEYDVHSQVYRPTEEEVMKKGKRKPSEASKPTGKLEDGAQRVDKGVNRFFKKIEKRIG